MKTTMLGLLAAFFLLGCGNPPTRLVVDYRFTPEQTEILLESADKWVEVSCGSFDYLPERAWVTEGAAKDLPGDTVAVKPGPTRPEWTGFTFHNPGDLFKGERALVILKEGTTEAEFRHATMHELGHALGLEHGKTGVMAPASEETELNGEDRVQARLVLCR